MIVGNPIIMILKAILNWFRLRRNYIANAVDKIPPEIKDALVAWYSPCKQKLTNYDVIEAYTENFKKWNNSSEKYTGFLTSNSLALTNVSQKTALIHSPIKPYDFKVLIRGLQEGQHVKFGFDYGELILEADKDGVYTLEWKEGLISYGIYTNFVGECNITITQLPTSILKDFSGNGNHAYLYGGKGKLNSGMGLYKVDFTTYINKNNILDIKPNSFITNAGASYINSYYSQIANNIPTYNIKVANLNGSIKYSYKDTDYTDLSVIIEKDGKYNLPISYKVNENKPTGFSINSSTKVTITQIPDYPDQLCYDGKMYAVAYGLPILTNYTVIADRIWFAEKVNNGVFMSKALEQNGAFILEYKQGDKWNTYSYYSATNINIDKDNSIVYQTKNKYNEQTIFPGDKQDTDTLFIGTIRKDDSRSFIGCHGDIILFNRTLTDDELDLVKKHFFGIVRIKDALLTVDGKPIITTDNKYIKINKK